VQAACELVAQYDSATEACTALVKEAAACWKRFEGTYRDDITAIVVFLPFLEGEAEDMADQTTPAQTAKARPPRLDASDLGPMPWRETPLLPPPFPLRSRVPPPSFTAGRGSCGG